MAIKGNPDSVEANLSRHDDPFGKGGGNNLLMQLTNSFVESL
jgi:hypothetical protein